MTHDVKLMSITRADLASICAIEQQVFRQPWNRRNFEDELSAIAALSMASHLVHSATQTLGGYLFCRLWVEELHILKLAVAPAWQRQGLGSKLVDAAIDRAIAQQVQTAWLEVRRSNQTAIGFYHSLGFKIVGQRVNYYSNRSPVQSREDALIMKRLLKEKR